MQYVYMNTNTTIAQAPAATQEAPASSIVRLQGVSKIYGSGDAQVRALDDVSVGFGAGEFTAIMGPSGSGKSTMMHILAGLDAPTSGHVFVEDTDITALKDTALTKLRRDRIGFVFQSFNLVPTLDARSNILLPMRLAGKTPDKDWFDLIVNSLGIADRLNHRPSEMSGGQQQRVAVARALMSRPAVIVADEPPATSTRTPPQRSWTCCAAPSTTSARASSWSPTTLAPPPTRIASSCAATAASSPTCATSPPIL